MTWIVMKASLNLSQSTKTDQPTFEAIDLWRKWSTMFDLDIRHAIIGNRMKECSSLIEK